MFIYTSIYIYHYPYTSWYVDSRIIYNIIYIYNYLQTLLFTFICYSYYYYSYSYSYCYYYYYNYYYIYIHRHIAIQYPTEYPSLSIPLAKWLDAGDRHHPHGYRRRNRGDFREDGWNWRRGARGSCSGETSTTRRRDTGWLDSDQGLWRPKQWWGYAKIVNKNVVSIVKTLEKIVSEQVCVCVSVCQCVSSSVPKSSSPFVADFN